MEEIPTPNCPKCGKEVPSEAIYCSWCGATLRVTQIKLTVLQEKIAECRHNEMEATIMLIPIFIMIIGGLYIGSITETRIEWPYQITYHPYADLALILLVGALILAVIIGVVSTYYWWKKYQYMKELERIQ